MRKCLEVPIENVASFEIAKRLAFQVMKYVPNEVWHIFALCAFWDSIMCFGCRFVVLRELCSLLGVSLRSIFKNK